MFERLEARVARRGAELAAVRLRGIAVRLGDAAPAGVAVGIEDERIVLSGPGLGRRWVSEAELRWLWAEVRDG